MGDGRTGMFLAGAVRLAVQIEEPTRGRERRTSASTDRAAAEGEGACPTLERRSLVLIQLYRWFPSVLKAITIIQPATLVRLLALEVVPTRRTTADRGGPARTGPADEHRESTLRSAAHGDCSSWGLRWLSPASPNTWSSDAAHQVRGGALIHRVAEERFGISQGHARARWKGVQHYAGQRHAGMPCRVRRNC